MSATAPASTPIVFCSDRKFAPYAAVATLTLIKTSDFPVLVYWLVRPADVELAETLRAAMPKGAHKIEIMPVDDSAFAGWGEHYHVSRGAYIRLLIPELLAHDRALYLDGDVMVRGSLAELLATDLGGCPIGGVANRRSDDLPAGSVCADTYINSGVLLMDLAALRRDRFREACEAIYRSRKGTLTWMDQDVINLYAEGRKHILDRRWNWQLRAHQISDGGWRSLLDSGQATIIHFLGMVKPWQEWCNPAIMRDWRREADEIGLGPEHYDKVSTLREAYFMALVADLNHDFKTATGLKNRIIERMASMLPRGKLNGVIVPFTGIDRPLPEIRGDKPAPAAKAETRP